MQRYEKSFNNPVYPRNLIKIRGTIQAYPGADQKVTRHGHCLSLATEWIENPVGDYVKQGKPVKDHYCVKDGKRISSQYRFQTNILYHEKYTLHWFQCLESRKKDVKPGKKSNVERSKEVCEMLKEQSRETICNIWENLVSCMIMLTLPEEGLIPPHPS